MEMRMTFGGSGPRRWARKLPLWLALAGLLAIGASAADGGTALGGASMRLDASSALNAATNGPAAAVNDASATANVAEKILVLRAEGPNFAETLNGLRHELGTDFDCAEQIVGKSSTVAAMIETIVKARPKAVVLMDNDAINLYAGVQKQWRDSVPYPPSIAMMAIRVDMAIRDLKRSEGIFYEVPGVTILVNLRSLLGDPVRRVGIIYRPSMEDFVRENAKWCKYENIELVPYVVTEDQKDISKAVRAGVRHLRDKDDVDALWILNDNFFLTPEIIGSGWLPALERFRKPVLVGVENFVSTRIRFGTFAILPDHYGLGVQAANMIMRLKEDGWEMQDGPQMEQPLAVYKILNLKQARKFSHINDQGLMEIDKVLK